jgi:hypothetical protein
MLKYLVFVIFLNVIITKGIHAKEEEFKLTSWREFDTGFDEAIGNCGGRPQRRTKWFVGSPPVSKPGFISCFQDVIRDRLLTYFLVTDLLG